MKFQITEIEFDCSLDDDDWTLSDQLNTEEHLNSAYSGTTWNADDEEDFIERISSKAGWCVSFVNYKHISSWVMATIKKHLVMSIEEQYAIVNALSFYHEYHTRLLDEDEEEQYRLAFKEDSYGTDFVDKLATKIANIFWTMKRRSRQVEEVLKEDRKIFVGKRGGNYYIDEDGTRVYLRLKKKPSRKYNMPRGAFARYVNANQN